MSTPTTEPIEDGAITPDLHLSNTDDQISASESGWLKATLPVAFISAFAELGLSVLNNEFQIFIPNGLGLSTVIMAMIMAPFFISEVVFKSPLGVLADRWGRKPLMVLGPAISIFTPLVLAAIIYPPHRIILPLLIFYGFLRLLDGLGAACLWPAMFAYIGDHVSEKKRASAMSVLNVTYMLGLAFGFLAGGWVNDTFGPVLTGQASLMNALSSIYAAMRNNAHHKVLAVAKLTPTSVNQLPTGHHFHTLARAAHDVGLPVILDRPAQFHPSFYLGSVLFALATSIALLTLNDKKDLIKKAKKAAGDIESARQPEKITWADFQAAIKCVPHLMLIALTTFTGMGCIMLLVKKFALDELGVTETEFGLLILWPAIFIGALAIPLGHVSDKVGSVVSVKVGFLVGAIGMWLLVLLYGSPKTMDLGLILGASLLGIGFVIAFPAWMALLTTMGNKDHRGTIVGAVSTAQGVGALIGTVIGSWLYEHGGEVWSGMGRLFGADNISNSHISHIAPFAASGVLLTVSSVMTFLLIKPTAAKDMNS